QLASASKKLLAALTTTPSAITIAHFMYTPKREKQVLCKVIFFVQSDSISYNQKERNDIVPHR
ncbi:19526_t:CDS:2, partial [Cetraspora pellucida]